MNPQTFLKKPLHTKVIFVTSIESMAVGTQKWVWGGDVNVEASSSWAERVQGRAGSGHCFSFPSECFRTFALLTNFNPVEISFLCWEQTKVRQKIYSKLSLLQKIIKRSASCTNEFQQTKFIFITQRAGMVLFCRFTSPHSRSMKFRPCSFLAEAEEDNLFLAACASFYDVCGHLV